MILAALEATHVIARTGAGIGIDVILDIASLAQGAVDGQGEARRVGGGQSTNNQNGPNSSLN